MLSLPEVQKFDPKLSLLRLHIQGIRNDFIEAGFKPLHVYITNTLWWRTCIDRKEDFNLTVNLRPFSTATGSDKDTSV